MLKRKLTLLRRRPMVDTFLDGTSERPMMVADDEVTTIPPDADLRPRPQWVLRLPPTAPPNLRKRDDT